MTFAFDRASGHRFATLRHLSIAAGTAVAVLLIGCQSDGRYHAPIAHTSAPAPVTSPDSTAAPVGEAPAATVAPVSGTTAVASLAVLALDIENSNGSVRVEVDPKATEITVEAKALNADGQLIKPAQCGELPWVKAELTADEGRGVLHINGIYEVIDSEGLPAPAFVMLRVRVPQCEGVRVRNTNGSVELINVAGAINVENIGTEDRNADIEVRTSKVLTDPITLTTSKGDILLRMPPGSKGKFELQSPSGDTQFLVRSGKVDNAFQKLTSYQATLNGGDNKVEVFTQDGAARVEVRNPQTHSANYMY